MSSRSSRPSQKTNLESGVNEIWDCGFHNRALLYRLTSTSSDSFANRRLRRALYHDLHRHAKREGAMRKALGSACEAGFGDSTVHAWQGRGVRARVRESSQP